MKTTLSSLKRHVIASSLFAPTTLKRAVERLGFVQADPIRSPARAQDLILRHRVKDYRAGDLEKKYPKLRIEEDFLYAYGFMPLSTWKLLHPRAVQGLSETEKLVLEIVSSKQHLHPRDLEARFGREREVNGWGGYSKATTRILHRLHHRGVLRVAARENGIRMYEAVQQSHQPTEPSERLREITLLIARILAPITESSLRATLRLLGWLLPLEGRLTIVRKLIASGELQSAEADGTQYLWPAGNLLRRKADPLVRFLAPFDPVVWDRARFEHFWGWTYRFEAYTPSAKRIRGYYSMPLLWNEDVIGWANVSGKRTDLDVQVGFVQREPKESAFRRGLELEVERMRAFLC